MDKAFNIGETVSFPSNLAQLIEDDDGFPHIMITHNEPSHKVQRMHFYVPDSILLDDSAQYDGLGMALSNARKLIKSDSVNATEADKLALSQELLSKVTGGATDTFTAIDNLTNKVALNPMTEMAFTSMGMRSFKLDLAMTPNNLDEAMSIIAIVNCFRELMYPAKTSNSSGEGTGFTLKYPAMWRLQFMVGENESYYMPTIYDSYLASMNTNYRGQSGGFIQIKEGGVSDYIGQRIDITLGFNEAKQLTRNEVYGDIDGKPMGRPRMGSNRGEIPAGSTQTAIAPTEGGEG